jgi:hypothetical protein
MPKRRTKPDRGPVADPRDRSGLALLLAVLSWFGCWLVLSVPAFLLSVREINRPRTDRPTKALAAFAIAALNFVVAPLLCRFVGPRIAEPVLGPVIDRVAPRLRPERARTDPDTLRRALERVRTDTADAGRR